jgi:hypothetical protein
MRPEEGEGQAISHNLCVCGAGGGGAAVTALCCVVHTSSSTHLFTKAWNREHPVNDIRLAALLIIDVPLATI